MEHSRNVVLWSLTHKYVCVCVFFKDIQSDECVACVLLRASSLSFSKSCFVDPTEPEDIEGTYDYYFLSYQTPIIILINHLVYRM